LGGGRAQRQQQRHLGVSGVVEHGKSAKRGLAEEQQQLRTDQGIAYLPYFSKSEAFGLHVLPDSSRRESSGMARESSPSSSQHRSFHSIRTRTLERSIFTEKEPAKEPRGKSSGTKTIFTDTRDPDYLLVSKYLLI